MPNRVNRAAQFLPFDSLKGLQEELRVREYNHSKEPKRDLDDERKAKISNELIKLEKGSIVKVTHYFDSHYFELTGTVNSINIPFRFIVVDDIKITFDDIYDLQLK